jgi:hypothetical protein
LEDNYEKINASEQHKFVLCDFSKLQVVKELAEVKREKIGIKIRKCAR